MTQCTLGCHSNCACLCVIACFLANHVHCFSCCSPPFSSCPDLFILSFPSREISEQRNFPLLQDQRNAGPTQDKHTKTAQKQKYKANTAGTRQANILTNISSFLLLTLWKICARLVEIFACNKFPLFSKVVLALYFFLNLCSFTLCDVQCVYLIPFSQNNNNISAGKLPHLQVIHKEVRPIRKSSTSGLFHNVA